VEAEAGDAHAYLRVYADGRADYAVQDRVQGTWREGVVQVVDADGLPASVDLPGAELLARGVVSALSELPDAERTRAPRQRLSRSAAGVPLYLSWVAAEPHRSGEAEPHRPVTAEPHRDPLTTDGRLEAEPHLVSNAAEPH
jgi:hypothetical protein